MGSEVLFNDWSEFLCVFLALPVHERQFVALLGCVHVILL